MPKELISHLSRFFDITEDAAPLAADVFIKNAKYCGVLDEKNVLLFKSMKAKLTDPNFQYAEVVTEEQSNENGGVNNIANPFREPTIPQGSNKEPLLLPEMINEEKVKIRLTKGKFAYLVHPLDLNKTDILILMKEIEKLQLIVEDQ
jgi:hypothetical protein